MESLNKLIYKEKSRGRDFEFHVPLPTTYGEAYDVAIAMASFFLEKNKETLEKLRSANKPEIAESAEEGQSPLDKTEPQ